MPKDVIVSEISLTKNQKRDKIEESATNPANSFRVTDIKAAVKNQHRVNIFVNNKFAFSLDLAQVVDFKLKIGKILTEAEIKAYKEASEFGKLYQRTLEWVLARPRSVRETRDYLRRKAQARTTEQKFQAKKPSRTEIFIPDEAMNEAVVARLIEKKYLDDLHFAKYYLENRSLKKGISAKRLRTELLRKGIKNELIDELIKSGERNDVEEIQKIITKKRARYTDDKLIAYLVRQGFDYSLSKEQVLNFENSHTTLEDI